MTALHPTLVHAGKGTNRQVTPGKCRKSLSPDCREPSFDLDQLCMADHHNDCVLQWLHSKQPDSLIKLAKPKNKLHLWLETYMALCMGTSDEQCTQSNPLRNPERDIVMLPCCYRQGMLATQHHGLLLDLALDPQVLWKCSTLWG